MSEPGEKPITYLVVGEAQGSAAAFVSAAGFLGLFNAAQGAGDSGRMPDMLHFAVVELYGDHDGRTVQASVCVNWRTSEPSASITWI